MARHIWRDEDGASSVEYGLIVVAIAALIVLVVFAFGGMVKAMFSTSCQTIKDNTGVTQTCT